jgi:hypothetical protein
MTRLGGLGSALRAEFASDPLLTLAVAAALFALATTPIAFALLSRTEWLETRRGRSYQRPAFWSVVCSMLLVMGIPAIFALIAFKSRHFDASRYEFDPNETISVLAQGRQYASLKEADAALQAEQARLEAKENELLNAVKKLDESMLALRSAAQVHPETYRALPKVMDTLADVHRAVGLDAPQQLINLTAPPAALAAATSGAPPYIPPPGGVVMIAAPAAPAAGGTAAVPAAAPSGNGLSKAEFDAELATVAPPQQAIARFLPLDDVPAGWVAPKSGEKHLETFNAENLFEKIDGRAESFIQYDVVGMAYTYFHPVGDEASEAQVYIFEMANALKAFGKYGSEKPDEVAAVPLGAEGYTAAGSVFFHLDQYYVQIVTTTDDPKVSAFALEIANKIAARMKPAGAQLAAGTPEPGAAAGPKVATPELLFKVLPAGPGRAGEKYVAQDVFGYSFFTDVFLADYAEGDATWQGFVRPYATPAEAKAIVAKYLGEVKEFGAQVKELTVEGADQAVQSTLDGLTDVILLKGNTVAGANGCTDAAKAEAFARAFAKTLPAEVPALPASPPKPAAAGGGEGY